MKRLLAGLVLISASAGAQAAGLDLALGSETANVQFLFNPYQIETGSGSELAIGAFVNEGSDVIVSGTLMASGLRQTDISQYNLGAAVKILGAQIDIDEADVVAGEDAQTLGALALGFKFGVLLNPSRTAPVEAGLEGYYAPNITSFSDAQNYFELAARLQMDIIPQAKAYVGYRRIRADTRLYDSLELDGSLHVGIRLTF